MRNRKKVKHIFCGLNKSQKFVCASQDAVLKREKKEGKKEHELDFIDRNQ